MKRNVKSILIVLVSILLMASLAGCGAETEPSSQGDAQDTTADAELFEIKYPTLLFSDPVYIADEKGFFAEQGIKVKFTGSLTGPDSVASVSNGSNDFGGTHASFITLGISQGFKVKAVAAGWASTEANPVNAWIVKKDSPYQTVQDLVGQTVADSPRFYPWLELLDQNGLKEDDINVVTVDFDKAEQALRQGDVAAAELLNPYLAKALQTGEFRVLTSIVDVVGEEKGWPQQFVNTDFLEKHPDVVKGFVTAIAKANDWANENPEEAGKIFAKRLGASEEFAPYYMGAYPEHALIDEADAQLWLDMAVKFGDIEEGQIKLSDIYTNEFNPYYKEN